MFVVSEVELGTAERRWRRAAAVAGAAEMEWPSAAFAVRPRAVVISPHPDDETLAIGGTLSMLVRRGFDIDVVAVTDGERSHPNSPTTSPGMLAERRRREQAQALVELGLDPARMIRLEIPDGRVAESDLAARLVPIVAGATVVLAPFRRDGHPDHDACGAAAERAHPFVISYLVWTWHWARPLDPSLPWAHFRRVTLDAQARKAKAHAITCFESQLLPLSPLRGDERLLPPAVVDRFARPFETVLVP